MLKKLLVVCGPTATGKTNLAYRLARKFEGELVSADSRQVYKSMDIGTGKDFYKNSNVQIVKSEEGVCYFMGSTPIWGYDLAESDRDFSVSQYFKIAGKFVNNIWHRRRLPIIVGGSGLYIRALIDGMETISIPPDNELRRELNVKDPEQLLKILESLDGGKANSMNESDRKNPRRLIRAIEIAYWNSKIKNQNSKVEKRLKYDSLMMIGLTSSRIFINLRIAERVRERIRNGFEEELAGFIRVGIDWKYQSMQSMGYRQYEKYFKGLISWQDFVDRWTAEEQKYAKRQMTWFKKDHRINWFDISRKNWEYKVEKAVRSWYYE